MPVFPNVLSLDTFSYYTASSFLRQPLMCIIPKHIFSQFWYHHWLGPFVLPASTWTSTPDDLTCTFWSYPTVPNLLLLLGPTPGKSHPVLQATCLGIISGYSFSCNLHFNRPYEDSRLSLISIPTFFLSSRISKFSLNTGPPRIKTIFLSLFCG